MLEKILRGIEWCIPKPIYGFFQPYYHWLLAYINASFFGFPSKKIKIIAVTGTKGKSSTAEIVNAILEEAGYKTALAGTIRFKIGEHSEPNLRKMTIPGRSFVQKFLRDAVNAKCDWVVLELTSQAVLQSRHLYVDLDTLIFTNLAPEHIESHGSYENYRDAKVEIAKRLETGKESPTLIYNSDDEASDFFIRATPNALHLPYELDDARPFKLSSGDKTGIQMRFDTATIFSHLEGEFNIYNILAAATFAKSIGIDTAVIKSAIEKLEEIPGRAQKIHAKTHIKGRGEHNFDVYVDYAHTVESLQALYKTFEDKRSICILGNTGGGRDTWKRPAMGKVADQYCSHIILTNEDPYDEDPEKIINEMKAGIKNKPCEIIMDRRKAIAHALSKAENGNVVLITGKGTDPFIMGPKNSKESWSDKKVVEEELKKLV